MWTKAATYKTKASKEQIWKLWSDVSTWNLWDDQVIESSLEGEFLLGQMGLLTPKGGPSSSFKLIEVTEGKSFTSRATLPLAKMDFVHTMKMIEEELVLTHRIEISGPSTFIFSRVIGNKLIKELPKALRNLANLAENK